MNDKCDEVRETAAPVGGRVPRLRFPEFKNYSSWRNRILSDILYEHGEKSTGEEDVFSVSVNKGLVNQIEHLGRRYSAANTDNYKRVMPGDIVYTKSPTGEFPFGIFKQSRESKSVLVSPLYGVFKPETKYIGFLLDAYFEFPEKLNNYLANIVEKGAKNTINISNKKFLSKSLILPVNREEQRKIAVCLSSLDELIVAHAKKLETLKIDKLGLMQTLFPSEGEKIPILRFPEFRNEGEWVERPAGDLFLNRVEAGEAKIAIYSVTINDGMVRRSSLDRDFDDIADPAKNKKVLKGDIAYNMMRMWQGSFGVASEDCMVSPAYVILNPQDAVDSFFYAYLLKTPRYLRELTAHSQGLTLDRLRLYYKDFADIELPFPPLPEQQKIAAALSSLDELIATQVHQIEALKVHKRGLVQGLFPAMDEEEA